MKRICAITSSQKLGVEGPGGANSTASLTFSKRSDPENRTCLFRYHHVEGDDNVCEMWWSGGCLKHLSLIILTIKLLVVWMTCRSWPKEKTKSLSGGRSLPQVLEKENDHPARLQGYGESRRETNCSGQLCWVCGSTSVTSRAPQRKTHLSWLSM